MPRIVRTVILSVIIWMTMNGAAVLAEPMSDYDKSELWFNSLPENDRNDIQSALIWTGGYNQIQDGVFGKNTYNALRAFESEMGAYADGILGPTELDRLKATSKTKKRNVGFKQVLAWEFWIGLPTLILSDASFKNIKTTETKWTTKDNRLTLFVSRRGYVGGSFANTYRSMISLAELGKFKFKTFRPNFFIFSSVNSGTQFYGRFHDDHGSVVGFVGIWRDGSDPEVQKFIVAISNSIEPGRTKAYTAAEEPILPELAAPIPEVEQRPVPEIAKKLVQTGTGFFVTNEGYLITNAHVVQGCRYAVARLADGRVSQTAIIAKNERADLALLKSQVGVQSAATFRISPPLRLGTDIIIFGYPRTDILTSTGNLVNGLVSGLAGPNNNASLIQISAPVQRGNSGGAVLDMSGNVVGVVVAKTNITGTSENIEVIQQANFAIHGDVVRTFLSDQRVPYSTTNSNSEKQTSDIADLAKSFTAIVECQPE